MADTAQAIGVSQDPVVEANPEDRISRATTAMTDAKRHGINEKTVRKRRSRPGVEDAAMDPKERRSSVPPAIEEAAIVALRVQARRM